MAVGHRKSGRLDDMGLHGEAGAEAQNRPGVLRDVGLKKDDSHRTAAFGPGGKVEEKSQRRAHLVRRTKCADSGLALSRQGCQ
jgi:hypothetical protein